MRIPTNGALGPACQRNCDVALDLATTIMKHPHGGEHLTNTLLDTAGVDHARKIQGKEADQN